MQLAETRHQEKIEAQPLNWGLQAVRAAFIPGGKARKLPFVRTTGLDHHISLIEAHSGRLDLSWNARESLNSFDGIIQGGVLTVIADYAQAHTFTTILERPIGFSTLDFNVRFLRPVRSGEAYQVESRILDGTARTAIIETLIRRSDAKPTTHITGVWQMSDRAFRGAA